MRVKVPGTFTEQIPIFVLTLQLTVMIESSCKEEVDMTIKEFSKLCDCNTQTLRYYDSIDLLKPARVDSFTNVKVPGTFTK